MRRLVPKNIAFLGLAKYDVASPTTTSPSSLQFLAEKTEIEASIKICSCPESGKPYHGCLIYIFEEAIFGDTQMREWLNAYDL